MGGTHRPCLPSSPLPPWRNHPQSPASNFAGRCVVSCQARNRPRAVGTRVAVLFVCWLAPLEATLYGTIVADPRRRRGAAVASSRCVGWRSFTPSPCWLPHGTAVRQPHIRSCPRRSRRLRRGSVADPEKSGSYESHGLRGARPLVPGCSSGSTSNRCRPSGAIVFPRVCAAHRSDLVPRSLARRGWPSSSICRPLLGVRTR